MGKSKDLATGNSAFYQDQTESDTRYVNTAGDTMTGGLTVDAENGNQLLLDNDGERFTQISLKNNGSQYAAVWYDSSINVLVNHAASGKGFVVQTGGSTDRLVIDSSGRVTMPSQPCFSAYRDAGHVTGGNVYIFDHTYYNVGNMYNSSNGRATVPVGGKYLVTVWLMNQNNATYDNKYIRLRINNSAYKNIYGSSGSAVHHQFSWSGVINLNANDYVDVLPENITVYGADRHYSNFSMQLLS